MTLQHLATAMAERRTELGLKQDVAVLAAGSGISKALWSQLENGHPGPRRRSTYAAVDRALKWPHGTALALASGTDPAATCDASSGAVTPAGVEARLAALEAAIVDLRAQLSVAEQLPVPQGGAKPRASSRPPRH